MSPAVTPIPFISFFVLTMAPVFSEENDEPQIAELIVSSGRVRHFRQFMFEDQLCWTNPEESLFFFSLTSVPSVVMLEASPNAGVFFCSCLCLPGNHFSSSWQREMAVPEVAIGEPILTYHRIRKAARYPESLLSIRCSLFSKMIVAFPRFHLEWILAVEIGWVFCGLSLRPLSSFHLAPSRASPHAPRLPFSFVGIALVADRFPRPIWLSQFSVFFLLAAMT